MKEVCSKTGLSDKTIRYYIRSGLIFPKYNENYTGRKNFDFSEKDIERLNQVVVLRKYHFSVSSIKTMLDDKQSVNAVVKTHIENMREENQNSLQLLSALDTIRNNDFSDAADLCMALCKTECMPSAVPSTDNKIPYRILYFKNKKANIVLLAFIFIIICASFVVFADVYNNVRCIADTSLIDVHNGFVGLRIIEADDKSDCVQYVNDLLADDMTLTTDSSVFKQYSTDVKKSLIGRDTITINAVVYTNKNMVKITPIYENRYSDEIIYCNSSYWASVRDGESVTVESQLTMKSKHYKYRYHIEFIPAETVDS